MHQKGASPLVQKRRGEKLYQKGPSLLIQLPAAAGEHVLQRLAERLLERLAESGRQRRIEHLSFGDGLVCIVRMMLREDAIAQPRNTQPDERNGKEANT